MYTSGKFCNKVAKFALDLPAQMVTLIVDAVNGWLLAISILAVYNFIKINVSYCCI